MYNFDIEKNHVLMFIDELKKGPNATSHKLKKTQGF